MNPELIAEITFTCFAGREPTPTELDREVEALDSTEVTHLHRRLLELDAALERRWKVLLGPGTARMTPRCARCGRTGL